MATNRRIVTTPLDGLRPLGTAGQRSFALITRAARDNFSEAHELLFAEPVPSPVGDTIDWYSGAGATLTPISQLGDDRRQRVLARLGELVADFLGYASRLESSNDPEEKRLGTALRNATEVPDESYIYASGDQPVVVCWSHCLNVRQAPRGVLSAHIPAKPRPGHQPVLGAGLAGSVARRQVYPGAAVAVLAHESDFGWLAWLTWFFIALVTGTIIYLLVTACGLNGIGALNFCPARVAAGVTTEEDRGAGLRDELARLQRDLGVSELQCLPVVPEPEQRAEVVPAPPEVSGEEEPDDFSQRVEEEGGDTEGAITVSLIWDTPTDLDLAVTCPGGQTIYFQRPNLCGGNLDVDANANDRRIMTNPVENVTFSENPPVGRYKITVILYKSRNRGARNSFRVKVSKPSGDLFFSGSLSATKSKKSFTFNYP